MSPAERELISAARGVYFARQVGPLQPSKCTAQGTGVSGGCASTMCSFTVLSRDEDGRRIREGGNTVTFEVRAQPQRSPKPPQGPTTRCLPRTSNLGTCAAPWLNQLP